MYTLESVWARPVAQAPGKDLALLPDGYELEQHIPKSNFLILKNAWTQEFLCCDATRLYPPFSESLAFQGQLIATCDIQPTTAGWMKAILVRNE
jgi:hypothetical protein